MTNNQRTPKGTAIPVPTRDDFFADLKKAATPEPVKKTKRRPRKRR